jgi:hypothetical protein
VFGLQELGATSNREAWSAALMKHLAPPAKEGAAAAAAAAAEAAAKAAEEAKKKEGFKFGKFGGGGDKDKPKTPADIAAEMAAAMGTTASKLSAGDSERAYVLLDFVNMWEMVRRGS